VRLRGGAARRRRQPLGCAGRRVDRRRAREPARRLRDRHRAEADDGAGADRRHADVDARGPVRQARGDAGMNAARPAPEATSKWVWAGFALLLIAAVVLPFLVKNYRVFQFNLVLVYAIAILGLNILTGFNGQISLGHGAFYAIGAYTAAILMDRA